jgi:hypothetical protein
MQSKAATVQQYLASLPADRRAALEAVRKVILANLDKDYAEGMQYGMIGYAVPHRVYPAGYHCDPSQPLCFAGLASQKNHCSLYLMSIYGSEKERQWFEREWKKSGKKLDMGKACIRFKSAADLPLELIGEAIARTPAKQYIAAVERTLAERRPRPAAKNAGSAGRPVAAGRKKAAKKAGSRGGTKKTARKGG